MAQLTKDPAIRVRDFRFAYRLPDGSAGADVVGPVDWTVEQGDFALLVGGTGCGKTTLMRNLKPELAPTGSRSGTLELLGMPADQMDAVTSAQTVGYVSQSPSNQIVCDSVWHELAFGLENLGTPVAEMRRRVAEVAHFFGIAPWLDQSTDALSGGQKQLLTLASVLALRPKILLLDEPTSQLDPVAAKNFLHALFRVNRELGLTVVVVTHEQEMVAEYATSLFRMEDGAVVQHDLEEYRSQVRQRAASVDYAAVCAPEPEGTKDPVVTLRDAYVRYARELPFVLRGLDLELRPGTVHALVGGNGCGKSTLLACLGGSLRLDRGKLRNDLRSCQALLPQEPKTLFVRDTVAEELAEWQKGCGYTDADVARWVERCGLQDLMRRHPYDLSGGQQQLLAFCKVALTRPRLLMMDEPTKGLDSSYRLIMADVLTELAADGVCVLMATHDLSFAARVSQVTSLLFDGQIACTQPTADFFRENLFYRPTVDRFFTDWRRP
ncbi:MAG: ATP-binding cassette domain-containing protein [Coriobacteriia bacterium]|nr:ATP-binding cassette domain-containing protein [Coriobacteriia bacterium]